MFEPLSLNLNTIFHAFKSMISAVKRYEESYLIKRQSNYDERKKFIRRNEFSGQTNYEMLMLRMEI